MTSTIVLVLVPHRQQQENAVGCLPSRCSPAVSSYAIGPLDPARIVPVPLPLSIFTHPVFKEGYEWGYSEGDPEDEEWTVPKLLNEVYHLLDGLRDEDEPDFCPWTLGFVLGELASVAEQDRILALTGLAHYCFLLSFIERWSYPFLSLLRARWPHDEALKAYRARVRVYKGQGMGFIEAQRLALVAGVQ